MKEEEIIALAPKFGLTEAEVESVFFKTDVYKKLYNILNDLSNEVELVYGLTKHSEGSLIILAVLKVLEDCNENLTLLVKEETDGFLQIQGQELNERIDVRDIELLPKEEIELALQKRIVNSLRT